jgi:hypothetical protein
MSAEGKVLSGRSPRQWQAHVELAIQGGKPGRLLVEEMVGGGYAPAEAHAIVSRAVRARNTRLGSLLGCSVLLTLMGIATIVTATEAGSGWLWIGAVVCGLIGIVYSIARLAQAR